MIIKKDILVLREGSTDELDDTNITAEAKWFINITKSKKEICLHYKKVCIANEATVFLCANGVKMYQFKAKHSGIKTYAKSSNIISYHVIFFH